jgi:protein-S-isoprenylcysteine O-methyltransferase Ste14
MKSSMPLPARLTVLAATTTGGASLLAFILFVLNGPVRVVQLASTTASALLLDGLLCSAFFVQHSGMVRRSFQDRIARFVPRPYIPAIYTIASGLALGVLLVAWQPTGLVIASAGGPFRWAVRSLAVVAVVVFVAGVRALRHFDPFGVRPIEAMSSGRQPRQVPLTIRGPYRWVRHPLYSAMLLLIWSYPELTADRLLFNVAWTTWIVVGTILEERDLVWAFGAEYRRYQRRVPMLLPVRLKPIRDEGSSSDGAISAGAG